ncbi:MAG: sigma-54 dependent transcriptional regulator, partial [Steroidobacteraceae bacterium]|nr:sigma-54 dependent transcriptional regulator [Steroidobacteraceae bacterium]
MKAPRALVIDDEPDIRELLGITLERMNIDVVAADSVTAATRELRADAFDLCLTDMRLPDGDGLKIVEWIQSHKPQTPVAVITAHGNVETAVRALKLGAFDFISKPLDVAALRKLISATLKLGEGAENTAQLPQIKLFGRSPVMQQLREMIERVARSQAPVHIYGESGTGKELVAHLIHEAGARRDGPFVPVNCGAIPTELMESELFGHKKGSFTGAVADKQGLIQSAEGGTLFLDEIADLPLHMQVKLLRVIQEKSVRPVGESKETPIDVRILSATHKNLSSAVAEGKFREDLFYRVNVIEIRVPPLRERLEDIDELVDSILRRLGKQIGSRSLKMTDAAAKALREYHFPGNVRELENVLERAATLCTDGVIDTADLQLRPKPAPGEILMPNTVAPGENLGEALEDIERDAILRALEQT